MRRMYLTMFWACALCITLLTGSTPSQAQGDLRLTIDPADQNVVMQNAYTDTGTLFRRNVRMRVEGGDANEVLWLASDLVSTTNPNIIIDRSSVSVPPGLSLPDGLWQDVPISVMNVPSVGEYTGTIQFFLRGQQSAITINILLRADVIPNVRPLLPNVSYKVVRCGGWLDCWLASVFVPDIRTLDALNLTLENDTSAPLALEEGVVNLYGERSGRTLGQNAFSIIGPQRMEANAPFVAEITMRPDLIPSDVYRGSIRFKVEGLATPVIVPADMSVRDGPALALLVIVFGIIIGRLSRRAEQPVVRAQITLKRNWAALRNDALSINDEFGKNYSLEQLSTLSRRIDNLRRPEDEATLQSALDQVDTQIQTLRDFDDLTFKFKAMGSDPNAKTMLREVQAAQRQVISNNIAAAQAARDQLNQSYDALNAELAKKTVDSRKEEVMGGDEMFDPAGGRVRRSMPGGEPAPVPVQGGGGGGRGDQPPVSRAVAPAAPAPISISEPNSVERFLAMMAGTRITASGWALIVQPILSIVLLFGLILVGMQTLYVGGNPAFGSARLFDYLGLFLWGVGADVAIGGLNTLLPRLGNNG
jgi:hypothetical protein